MRNKAGLRRLSELVLGITAVLLSAGLVMAGPGTAPAANVGAPAAAERGRGPAFSVDVACDANTFAFQGPTLPGGGPAYGASFFVEGVIYPGGTLAANGNGSGLLPDGTPEFPDLVIGKWTCRGWFTGNGIATASGPFVATTQLYDLDLGTPGAELLVSDGIELIDLGVPFSRAVTGGTGRFQRSRGEVVQTAVGANATGLFNFTFDFHITPHARP